jgi:hypothetical protein
LPKSLGITKVLLGISLVILNLLGYKLSNNRSNNTFNNALELTFIAITITLFNNDDILYDYIIIRLSKSY